MDRAFGWPWLWLWLCGVTPQCSPAPKTCSADADCSSTNPSFVCVAGMCVQPPPACRDDRDCPAGEACIDSQCVGGTTILIGCIEARDAECDADEVPAHAVRLNPFALDPTEVTQRGYQECIAAGGCTRPGSEAACGWNPSLQPDFPVVCVTWSQANAFCQWRGQRLPTEAEWEVAARGGTRRLYPWGDAAPTCSLATFGDCSSTCRSVGSTPAGNTPDGLKDLAGNVFEWVADWYDPDYYASSPVNNPAGPSSGEKRVMRGGSFQLAARYLRASNRGANLPAEYFIYQTGLAPIPVGFRCAKSL